MLGHPHPRPFPSVLAKEPEERHCGDADHDGYEDEEPRTGLYHVVAERITHRFKE